MIKSFIIGIKSGVLEMPQMVRSFLIKAVLLFLIWEVVYLLILLPDRIIDRPLSLFTAESTVYFLNKSQSTQNFIVFEYKEKIWKDLWMEYDKTAIVLNGKKIIGIADSCNGLSLIVLFIGFIICFPKRLNKKIWFICLGTLLIIVINIIRCFLLAKIQIQFPEFLDFAHYYLFNITTYSIVFYLWYRFANT